MYPTKITFRLSNSEARILYQNASDRRVSPHQEAKRVVVMGLTLAEIEKHMQNLAGDVAGLQQSQSKTADSLAMIQSGLIDALAVILAATSPQIDQEHAREWVQERFQEQF